MLENYKRGNCYNLLTAPYTLYARNRWNLHLKWKVHHIHQSCQVINFTNVMMNMFTSVKHCKEVALWQLLTRTSHRLQSWNYPTLLPHNQSSHQPYIPSKYTVGRTLLQRLLPHYLRHYLWMTLTWGPSHLGSLCYWQRLYWVHKSWKVMMEPG